MASGLSSPTAIAVTGTASSGTLYVSTGSAILSCSLFPCAQPTTLLSGLASAQTLALYGNNLYFEQTSAGVIQTLDVQTGAVSTLYNGTPSALAVDGNGIVYFGDFMFQGLWMVTGPSTATPWGPTITNTGLLQGPMAHATFIVNYEIYVVDTATGCTASGAYLASITP